MKKISEQRKSERVKEYDPEVLNDLKKLYDGKKIKTCKRLGHKKKKNRKVNCNHLDGVLGLASLIRETEPVKCKAATHVYIAQYIFKQLTNQ